jgi:hypothetical protein
LLLPIVELCIASAKVHVCSIAGIGR